jgi:hypothetical protein
MRPGGWAGKGCLASNLDVDDSNASQNRSAPAIEPVLFGMVVREGSVHLFSLDQKSSDDFLVTGDGLGQSGRLVPWK